VNLKQVAKEKLDKILEEEGKVKKEQKKKIEERINKEN
jgi:hypothetical protein